MPYSALGGQADPLLLHGDQPEKLNIQIVVRQRFAVDRILIKGHIVDLAPPFIRSAQRAADVLAEPAAENFIS